MNGIADLGEVETWRKSLGLIAVPLHHGDEQRFVMLNGSRGNFCLDLSGNADADFARNAAWSSDVGHYVEVLSDRVTIHRWDLSAMEARPFERASVAANLSDFQRLLERNDPDRERSVVRFVARMFGTVRSIMGAHRSGLEAMEVFLVLLACAADNVLRSALNVERWGLTRLAIEASQQVDDAQWGSLLSELRLGRPHDQLRPLFEFVLRHAAGQVFQEAHYLADFPHADQLLLRGFLPEPARKRNDRSSGIGVYFTPPYLARTLAEQCVSRLNLDADLRIFDPACGSGEILREAARQLEQRGFSNRVELIGWDLSPIACEMARYVLAWEREHSGLKLVSRIEQRDSINEAAWPSDVNGIVMNPPFVSYHRMSLENARAVSQLLGPLSGRLPDMSTAFVLRAGQSVAQDGVVGTILPASLLDNPSSAGVRKYMADRFQPSLLAKLGDQTLFRGALVDAAMYVGIKTETHVDGVVLWADFTKEGLSQALRDLRRFYGAPISHSSYSIYALDETLTGSASWLPRPYEVRERLRSLSHLPQVQELFEIRQGIRSGADDVFIIDPETWREVPRKERRYFRRATVNRSIRWGRVVEAIYLFFPYERVRIESETELHRVVPWFYENRLKKNKRRLQGRKGIGNNPWWELTWPRLRDPAPKFVSTAFGRRGSFAWDETGDLLVLMGFAWHPKLGRFSEMPRAVAAGYLAVLNSEFFDGLLAGTSRHVGGGQWDLQNHYVKTMRIPNLLDDGFPISSLRSLSKIGEAMMCGETPDEASWRDAVESAYFA